MSDSTNSAVRKRFLWSVLAIGAAVGLVYALVDYRQSVRDEAFKAALLLKDVEMITAQGQILRMLDEERPEKARELAEMWVGAATSHGGDLVREGVVLDGLGSRSIPNLLEGVMRARNYAEKNNMDGVASDADEILRALSGS